MWVMTRSAETALRNDAGKAGPQTETRIARIDTNFLFLSIAAKLDLLAPCFGIQGI